MTNTLLRLLRFLSPRLALQAVLKGNHNNLILGTSERVDLIYDYIESLLANNRPVINSLVIYIKLRINYLINSTLIYLAIKSISRKSRFIGRDEERGVGGVGVEGVGGGGGGGGGLVDASMAN
ncbi:hypothetical protein EJ05DRAFT_345522 [Pseudovirgaria hyperparasitica]|uniref:Uncharacterized protein n=1 Tax=Pseudovirgaria hyperparasitica TaxID=470096 RepID=A0A6A6VRD0_9PEZI|nr:uncharacterized protein EJ05DRAFT_345522 [Pseudovirgaria hyperparasitica]KAF2752449.1 hypothetical protein EJ05DRAFT_345522 [Pseudovirgaria hyperparasitica]